jgi:ATP-dependent phosphoenolpyruvate carboxykinase
MCSSRPAQTHTTTMPVFGLAVPVSCPGVEAAYLDPRSTWSNEHAYDAKLASLAREFDTNFTKCDQLHASLIMT